MPAEGRKYLHLDISIFVALTRTTSNSEEEDNDIYIFIHFLFFQKKKKTTYIMRPSSKAIALPLLGLATHLFLGSTTAVPLDTSVTDQKALGFDPDTYLYFTDDFIPQDGPGPAPNVTVPGWVPPPLGDDGPKIRKRGETDDNGGGKPPIPSDDKGSSDSDEDLDTAPMVWYDRSRGGNVPFFPAEYNVRRALREAAQRFVAGTNYPVQPSRVVELRYFNTDGTWQYLIQLAWINTDNYRWPILSTPGASDLMVRRDGGQGGEEGEMSLNDWLTARIDPGMFISGSSRFRFFRLFTNTSCHRFSGSLNGYSGLVALARGHITFGYRIWHIRDVSQAIQMHELAQRRVDERRRAGQGNTNTQQQPAPNNAGQNPNPAPAPPTTPFGAPIVERPVAPPPSLKVRGEDTGVARMEEMPVSQALLPSPPPPDGLATKLVAFAIFVLMTMILQK